MRLFLFVAAALPFVASCGEKYNVAELACQDAFVAEEACVAEAGLTGAGISKEQQCAAEVSATGDDEAALEAKAAEYDCELAVWQDGDCSTEDGVAAADQAAVACHF